MRRSGAHRPAAAPRKRGRSFLSPPSVILSAMQGDHPWRRLRDEHPDWAVEWTRLPDGILGATDHTRRLILLDERLLQAERRCTIAHELEHVRRGPVPDDDLLAAREEAAIDLAVSQQLIRIDDLGDALAWSRWPQEAADELWVDAATLAVRLRHLTPAETEELARRLSDLTIP